MMKFLVQLAHMKAFFFIKPYWLVTFQRVLTRELEIKIIEFRRSIRVNLATDSAHQISLLRCKISWLQPAGVFGHPADSSQPAGLGQPADLVQPADYFQSAYLYY